MATEDKNEDLDKSFGSILLVGEPLIAEEVKSYKSQRSSVSSLLPDDLLVENSIEENNNTNKDPKNFIVNSNDVRKPQGDAGSDVGSNYTNRPSLKENTTRNIGLQDPEGQFTMHVSTSIPEGHDGREISHKESIRIVRVSDLSEKDKLSGEKDDECKKDIKTENANNQMKLQVKENPHYSLHLPVRKSLRASELKVENDVIVPLQAISGRSTPFLDAKDGLKDNLLTSDEDRQIEMTKAERTKEKEDQIEQLLQLKRKMFTEILNGEYVTPIIEIAPSIYSEREQSNPSERKWDFVICFSNPDNESGLIEGIFNSRKSISEKAALEIFRTCFKEEISGSPYLTGQVGKLEENVFVDCFGDLKDFENEKLLTKGGRFKRHFYENTGDSYWAEIEDHEKDFRNMIMNLCLAKLVYGLGFEAKLIMSHSGETIYMVLRASDAILKIWGEKLQSNVEYEIGRTDLSSLEPCDSLFVRYREMQKPQGLLKKEGDLKDLFHIIDKQTGDKEMTLLPTSAKITEDHWSFYSEFLKCLQRGYQLFGSCPKEMKDEFAHKLFKYSKLKANSNIIKRNPKLAKARLRNLWDRYEFASPVGAFDDYEIEKNPKIWRQYVIDEHGKQSIFMDMDKLKIFNSAIQSQLVIPNLLNEDVIKGYFPLHNEFNLEGTPIKRTEPEESSRTEGRPNKTQIMANLYEEIFQEAKDHSKNNLKHKWRFHWRSCTYVPENAVRKYFGEKLGMYFQWMSHYAKYCLGFSFIGLITAICIYILNTNQDEEGKPGTTFVIVGCAFILLIVIWSTIFQEHWKRTQVHLSTKWMQVDFEADESIRAEFQGVLRRSPVTDQHNELYYPELRRIWKIAAGALLSLIMISLTITATLVISYYKNYYVEQYEGEAIEEYIPTIASALNAVQILIFNLIYGIIAIKLTNYENHRTQTKYEISLIIKTYIFQFVNSYFSLFFIAFLKNDCIAQNDNGEWETDSENSCIYELEVQLRMIFILMICKNAVEIGVPYLIGKYKSYKIRKHRKGTRENIPIEVLRFKLDKEFALDDYSEGGLDGTYGEYLEMVIQYGYMVLFGFAFPLAIVLAAINNVIELQLDKAKIVNFMRRPIPQGAANIGIWEHIISIISFVGVLSNVGLITLTLNAFDSETAKYTTFIGLCLLLFLVKFAIDGFIPDIPYYISFLYKRHESIKDRTRRGMKKDLKISNLLKQEVRRPKPHFDVAQVLYVF